MKIEESIPKNYEKFRGQNKMDPGEQPKCLKNLSEIEQLLIAQVNPVLTVMRLRGEGQLGYRGQVMRGNTFRKEIIHYIT